MLCIIMLSVEPAKLGVGLLNRSYLFGTALFFRRLDRLSGGCLRAWLFFLGTANRKEPIIAKSRARHPAIPGNVTVRQGKVGVSSRVIVLVKEAYPAF